MHRRKAEIDPLTRLGTGAVAAARIGIGIGAFFVPRPALERLGFTDPDPQAIAFARLAGGRDIALGLHALAVRGDRDALREATVIGAGVDAGDSLAFGALALDPARRGPGLFNAALGALGAVGGAVLAHRLR